ncbi:AraC-like ligand-binding domain-containing protein [Streptomyces odontomachi]|uniref:AraC-like ligand-binding domain-containing protein n=1 Tax=Streptomyces odontomachi TaxID=2944940 RepID=UPI00210CF1F8|nr:helix-turn-helix domain-containing protein [Streptomyces sp. ODS25]
MPTVLRTEAVPLADRLDFLHEGVRDMLVPLRMSPDSSSDYRAAFTCWNLGGSLLIDKTGQPITVERTPRLIHAGDPELYKIELQLHGASVVARGDDECRITPGQATLLDTSRPYRLAARHRSSTSPSGHGEQAVRQVTLAIPHRLMPLNPDDADTAIGSNLSAHLPTGRLLAATVAQLTRSAADGDEHTATRLVAVVVDLLTIGLASRRGQSPPLSPSSRRQVLLARIEAFVESHLAEPRLSPAMIAAAHHMSQRSLHQLFATESDTPVSKHIRRRRLERCRRALTDPAQSRRPVAVIAAQWGFQNIAHFTRLFHAAYGQPPAAYRQTHARP